MVMEKNKLLTLIAGIVGLASLVLPAIGLASSEELYWSFGFRLYKGEVTSVIDMVKEEDLAMVSFTYISAALIAAGSAVFLVSMIPKLKAPLFTMLGWIVVLAGCGCYMVFGFGANIDGPLFLWPGMYPVGIIASFASGGLGLVSWLLQTVKR